LDAGKRSPGARQFRIGGMIVLASQSPRRAELLQNAGIEFIVHPAHIPEQKLPHESAEEYVQRLAREKACAVHAQRKDGLAVLGADTTVVLRGELLEKPVDRADAARMLRALSGQTHLVLTGVCLKGDGFEDVQVESTEVRFATLTEEEIRDYVATGEPMDKAGAYAIQGVASRWIERLDGDYFNVVGLPVPLVYRMLRMRNGERGMRNE
jgi:septum formation protein